MSTIPTTASRTAELSRFGHQACTVLEIDFDKCANTYGVAPCTATGATGSECYNCYGNCQDQAHYVAATNTVRFVSRGVESPLGTPMRPYLLNAINAPANLDIEAGLASRSSVSITLADEPCPDTVEMDPYFATRLATPGGTYWGRMLARNKYYYGRVVRLRRGFVADPWDWNLFLDELYVIDSISGPDKSGQVKLTLKDPVKWADKATIPAPTAGMLAADFKAVEYGGSIVAADTSTITFSSDASTADSYYNGMEIYIPSGVGSGQRRVVSSYVGATRVATLISAWSVIPTTASGLQVSALSIPLDSGSGALYTNPATSGKNEYVRVGSEIIRYSGISGDTLTLADGSYRAQFGTTIGDGQSGDGVQLCRAYINQSIYNVLHDLLNQSTIPDSMIDLTGMASACSEWYDNTWNITACLSSPEKGSKLLADLLQEIGAVMWWSPQMQKVTFKAIAPALTTPPLYSDDSGIMQDSTNVQTLDALRITEPFINYGLRDATANLTEPRSFLRAAGVINTSTEGANEYGDQRQVVLFSRWFGTANDASMQAAMERMALRLADAPKQVTLSIDKKDYMLPVGELVDISSRRIVDTAGNNLQTRCIITKVADMDSRVDLELRTTNFNSRAAIIAPDPDADYPTETVYAHIADSTGLMSDGTAGYTIN